MVDRRQFVVMLAISAMLACGPVFVAGENTTPRCCAVDVTDPQMAPASDSHHPKDATQIAAREPNEASKRVYRITSVKAGKCLDVASGSLKKGANVQVYKDNGTEAQRWQVILVRRNEYKIASLKSGLVLDVANGSRNNGANVWQWQDNGTDAQLWRLVRVDEGVFRIINVKSGRCLGITDGPSVRQWRCNGQDDQQWRLERLDK